MGTLSMGVNTIPCRGSGGLSRESRGRSVKDVGPVNNKTKDGDI